MALKKSELYSSLWASCDELRGGMDASQYKDYVLVLLFVKYISDRYAGQPYAPITIPKGATFSDMAALKGKSDIGDQINKKILAPLAQANKLSDMPDFNDPTKLGSGKEMVERLTNLISIFENPALDFSKNRADGDDLLGDAYEYLMRHFATESGKSKGQFYTPAEVSRVIANILGIRHAKTSNDTTVYDPTCGSGSLLLKVGDEAHHGEKNVKVTLYGQEKDNATAGLARMNMILHDYATAEIEQGNTLASPKFLDGDTLRTFDYVVANPPFSDKRWSTGLSAGNDQWDRFKHYGIPPAKQGDYAYLLHILRSMKSAGKGACILPHGVLFRGNAEAEIRKNLIRRGVIKGIIGLPANLFYGTSIPACIVLLDKEGAPSRKAVFMIDASKGFRKDGNKNRLREQDLHRIVDTFTRQAAVPGYSRLVPVAEISDPKNDYNLNLPRYIDSTEPEDLQDIDAHLRGGIPARDLDALERYWEVIPGVRAALFKKGDRAGYAELKRPIANVKEAIFGHPEFTTFNESVTKLFEKWRKATTPPLKEFSKNARPKALIDHIAEDLLATFKKAALIDPYDVYQHLMDYWAASMQDDCYLIASDGWKAGAQPREILQVKSKDGKLAWPEAHDYKKGKRRFKSDLIPADLLIARYFVPERDAITAVEGDLSAVEQLLEEQKEEHGGEDGLLAEVIEGEGDKQKITTKALKARLKEIGKDPEFADERNALEAYAALLDKQADAKARLKAAQEGLDAKVDAKYPKLAEDEIKTLVVDDKWMATIASALQAELDQVSQTLSGRIRQLAERYATPLPELIKEASLLTVRVQDHLKKLSFNQFDAKQLLTGKCRLPGFAGDWEVKRMGDLGSTYGGLTGKTKRDFGQGSARFITFMNVMANVVIDCEKFDRVRVSPSESQNAVTKGDLFFNGSSETPEEVALCAVLADEVQNVFLNSFCFGFRVHEGVEADGLFLAYYFRSMAGREMMKALAQGSTRYNISKSALLKASLSLPSLDEQRAIAAVLADMDKELVLLEGRRSKASALKQGMMQALLTTREPLV